MICGFSGGVRLVCVYGTDVGLADVRLGGFLPDDIGVLGARARLVACPDRSGGIADVGREAARGRIAVIGLVPGAAQFGHASVCPQIRSVDCG